METAECASVFGHKYKETLDGKRIFCRRCGDIIELEPRVEVRCETNASMEGPLVDMPDPPPTEPAPPATSGGDRTPESKRHPIADRIEAYLRTVKGKVFEGHFSVTDQTVDNILKGNSMPRQSTVAKLNRELDQLEKKWGPFVERLPTKLPPVRGVNLDARPSVSGPPRQSRTP